MRKKVVGLYAVVVDIFFSFLPYTLMDLKMPGEYHWVQKMLVLKMCPNFAQSKSLLYGLFFSEPCHDLS